MARPPSSSCLRRIRCPIHGIVKQTHRRHASGISHAEVKELVPTMKDSVVWKWDQVTMAMSGGVDSAVALRILSEWPVDLNVIFMRNWDSLLSEASSENPPTTSYAYSSDPSSPRTANMSPCGWQKDWDAVQKVCAHVGIPEERVRLVDLSQEYWTRVFEPAINVWQEGGTPNPDVACNREIKFGALLDHVPTTNRSFLATGHYARVKRVPHATRLCRADDMTKDQSYFLSAITEQQLRRALFPLAGIKKEDTRRLARYYGLPNAEKEESMGLCFVGERGKFGNFVSQYVPKPAVQGYLVDAEGKRLAPHDGLWRYTEGQGARIGGQAEPMFVAKKCIGESKQDILVVPGGNHPALMCTRLHTHDFHWIAGKVPKGMVPGGKKRATVQLKHRMEAVPAVISHDWNGEGLTIDLLQPVHGVATGQVCAVYYLNWCVGSGIIKQTWTSDTHPVKRYKAIKEAKGNPDEYFGAEESDRLLVEEMEDDEGGDQQPGALPEPVTVYAEEENQAEGQAVVPDRVSRPGQADLTADTQETAPVAELVWPASRSDKTPPATADEFWSSAETAIPTRQPKLSPTQSLRKASMTDAYLVSKSPFMKGFGAPTGYHPATPFGDITRRLQREWAASREAAEGHMVRAEYDDFERDAPGHLTGSSGPDRRDASPRSISGPAGEGHDTAQDRSGVSRSTRRFGPNNAGKPRARRGPAMPLGERRSTQRGFGLEGSGVKLEDRPLAFEASAAIKQERADRRRGGWETGGQGRTDHTAWGGRGRQNGKDKTFGAPQGQERGGRPRGEFIGRSARGGGGSGFGLKDSA